jgi:hypothetical protein
MRSIIIILILITYSASANIKPVSDSIFSWKKIIFPIGLVDLDTAGVKVKIPFSISSPELKFKGTHLIEPIKILNSEDGFIFLPSWFYYLIDLKSDTLKSDLHVKLKSINDYKLDRFLRPFYIADHEITNGEYREFVNWVRDSIARTIIADDYPEYLIPTYNKEGNENDQDKWILNWSRKFSYYDEKLMPLLTGMYLPENERFYTRREFDVRKFNYVCLENRTKKIVNIYPDTLTWIHNIIGLEHINPLYSSLIDPMTQIYYWHSTFEDYPVVGITYEQAEMFCHWKGKMLQNELLKKGSKDKIEVDVPTDYEWEAIEVFIKQKESGITHIPFFQSVFDLILSSKDILPPDFFEAYFNKNEAGLEMVNINFNPMFYYELISATVSEFKRGEYCYYKTDPRLYTGKKERLNNESDHHTHYSLSGIHGYFGHVSEWINADLTAIRDTLMKRKKLEHTGLWMSNENFRYPLFRPGGIKTGDKMISGANFLDRRNFMIQSNAQPPVTFSHPDSAYCTVGFRYVIRIKS